MEVTKKYKPLTFRAWLELATPNTWGASVIPVLLGAALAAALDHQFNPLYFVLLLIAAVSMHCAVNAFNHGFDSLNGTDNLENCLDPTDAPVVYHQLNPIKVILLGFFYLFFALVVAVYLLWQCGVVLLLIGGFGAAVTILYAGGPLPITHTPFGEFFAGFTMGGLITFAVYYAMTLHFNLWVFVYALPMIVVIGMVLLLNNVCDIEKDIPTGRHTLPILLGRPFATFLLRAGYSGAILLIGVIGLVHFAAGMWLFPLLLIAAFPKMKALYQMEFKAETRIKGMKTVLPLTPLIGLFYVAMICLDLIIR